MIELNGTFLIQLANFIVMIFLLNYLLFKPVMEIVEKRNKALKGLNTDAAAANQDADKLVKQMEDRLAEVKKSTSAIMAAARQQGTAEQESLLKNARKDYAETLNAALAKVGAELEGARKTLKAESAGISREMAKRILGREVR